MNHNGTLRGLRGIRTLAEVARETGFSAGHISKAERAKRTPGPRMIAALRRFYRVSSARWNRAWRATVREYHQEGRRP